MLKTVYFICTGNSARSQMAEGFAKKHLDDDWKVYSGGIEAHGVNPNAIKAMQEVGIDISQQESNMIDMNLFNQADLVVTLCSDAEERCPVVPSNVKKEHWPFDDPAAGDDYETFVRVRNEIDERIQTFANTGR